MDRFPFEIGELQPPTRHGLGRSADQHAELDGSLQRATTLDTLAAMSDLARTRWVQGDWGGARELEEQVLKVRCRVLGEEHPDTLAAMSNLAQTRWASGDLGGGRGLGEQVVDVSRRVLGEEHPNTLAAMYALMAIEEAQRKARSVR